MEFLKSIIHLVTNEPGSRDAIASKKTYLKQFNLLQGISDIVLLFQPVAILEQNFNSLVIISFRRINHGIMVGLGST